MGECHHEMPGLPYPAFRMVNAEPGDGKPAPDGEGPCADDGEAERGLFPRGLAGAQHGITA